MPRLPIGLSGGLYALDGGRDPVPRQLPGAYSRPRWRSIRMARQSYWPRVLPRGIILLPGNCILRLFFD